MKIETFLVWETPIAVRAFDPLQVGIGLVTVFVETEMAFPSASVLSLVGVRRHTFFAKVIFVQIALDTRDDIVMAVIEQQVHMMLLAGVEDLNVVVGIRRNVG